MINLKTINLGLYSLIAAFVLINLFGTNSLATQGIVVDDLYFKTQELQKQNQELEIEINKLGNLSRIYEIASSQGYQHITQPIALSGSSLVAEKPATIYP